MSIISELLSINNLLKPKEWFFYWTNFPLRAEEKRWRCPDNRVNINLLHGTVTHESLWVIHIINQSAKELYISKHDIKYRESKQTNWNVMGDLIADKLINKDENCEPYNDYIPSNCGVEFVWRQRAELKSQYEILVPYKYNGKPLAETCIQVKDYR